VAVERRVDEADLVRADEDPSGRAPVGEGADRSGEHRRLRRLGHRLLCGDVDVLAEPRPATLGEREEGADGPFEGRMVERLGFADPHGRAVGVTGEDELAARRGDRQVGCRPVRLRPVVAERRDGDRHERRVRRSKCREVDGHTAEGTRGVQQDVRVRGERGEGGRVGHGDGPLAPVEGPVAQARVGAARSVDEGRHASGDRPLGGFEQNDVGPELGEEQSSDLAPVVGRVEDAQVVEHAVILAQRVTSRSADH